ncbi:hypothetical protein [Thalassotalea euphylliae]|nr:hypothetical protein [Thalassotalea euphylliae]
MNLFNTKLVHSSAAFVANFAAHFVAYFDNLEKKCDSLIALRDSGAVSETELIHANNQLLTDLINAHAKCSLMSQFVGLNSDLFERKIAYLFGEKEFVKEVIRIGSNLSDYFGYCGFSCDSTNIFNGFSLVIDRNILAFSPNDVNAFSDLILKNIRFRKAVSTPTSFDPAYQLPTYSIAGVSFYIVPVSEIKYPYIDI